MSEINPKIIRYLTNNYTTFDLNAALALKIGIISLAELDKIEILEKAIEETMKKVGEAEEASDLNRAVELKYGIGEDYNKELEAIRLDIVNKVNSLFSRFSIKD